MSNKKTIPNLWDEVEKNKSDILLKQSLIKDEDYIGNLLANTWYQVDEDSVRTTLNLNFLQVGGSSIANPCSEEIVVCKGWNSGEGDCDIKVWNYVFSSMGIKIRKNKNSQKIQFMLPNDGTFVNVRLLGSSVNLSVSIATDLDCFQAKTYNHLLSKNVGQMSRNSNGWCKFANGLIIQWGTVVVPPKNSYATVALPINFSDGWTYTSVCSGIKNVGTGYMTGLERQVVNASSSTIEIASNYDGSSSARWLAVGF